MVQKHSNLHCIHFYLYRLVSNLNQHPATKTENFWTKSRKNLFDQNGWKSDWPLPEPEDYLGQFQTRMPTSWSKSGSNLPSGNPERIAQDPRCDGFGCQGMARQWLATFQKVFESEFAFRQEQMVLHVDHQKSSEELKAETETKRFGKKLVLNG